MIFLSKHLNSKNSAKAIYGIILIQALLISLDQKHADPFTVAIKTFVGALIIVFAEIYSEYLGGIIQKKGFLNKIERDEIKEESFIVSAVSITPTILFLISGFGLLNTAIAFKIAYLLGLIELTTFGYIASESAGHSFLKNIKVGLITGAVGFAIIAIKYYFNH